MADLSRLDKRIEALLKPTVYRLLDAAEHTAASKRRARERIRLLLRNNSKQRKQTLVNEYADGALSRRRFLKLLGVGVIGAAAGASGATSLMDRPQKQPTPTGNAAANTVNAVDDLGWDPEGNSDIASSLRSNIASNTTIQVPPGEYRFESQSFVGSVNNFTLEGLGESHHDVVFKPPKGWRGPDTDGMWLAFNGGNNITLRNFSIQQYDDIETTVAFKLQADNFLLEDVEHLGFTPDDGDGSDGYQCSPQVTSRDGEGIVRRYYNRQGGQIYTYPERQGTMWVGASHSGTLVVENCVVIEGGGSAIYGTRHQGTIRVNSGYWANNDHHDMRISNERNDQQGWVKNAVFFGDYDEAQFSKTQEAGGGHEGGEGWWIEHGGTELLIENCDFVYRDTYPTNPDGAHFPGIVQTRNYSGPVTFRNCRFENSITNESPVQGPSINAGTGSITIEQCHFVGEASQPAVASSTDCEVIDCCINMPNGGAINGARTQNVERGADCDTPDLKELDSVYQGADAPATAGIGDDSNGDSGGTGC